VESPSSSVWSRERDGPLVPWPVYLWELDESRGAAFREELGESHWVSVRPGVPEVCGGHSRCGYGVVVSCRDSSAVCPTIQLHKQRGASIFCLVSCACAEAIGQYSKLLLAGADCVINGSSPDWMAQLSSAILDTAESALCQG